MQIDWFTFGAQMVNFLVLVWLLRRFLYGPVLAAMDEREATLAATQAEADARRAAADREAEEFRRKSADLEAKQGELMAQARSEAEATKRNLLHEARTEAEEATGRWRESLAQDRDSFIKELRQRSSEEVWTLARRVLAGLASAELERQVTEVFRTRVAALPDAAREPFRRGVAGGEPLLVRSAFAIQEEEKREITAALRAAAGSDAAVRFETDPAVVAGIEVAVAGHKMAWSVGDYLTDLEERLATVIDAEAARA